MVGTDGAILSVGDEKVSSVAAAHRHHLGESINTPAVTPATRRVRHTRQTRRVLCTDGAAGTHVRLQELHRYDVTLFCGVSHGSRPLQLHHRRHLHTGTGRRLTEKVEVTGHCIFLAILS